jgi:thioredoxin reductase
MRSAALDAVVSPVVRYTRWLHTRWPAGTVERLPVVGDDGATAVPGLYVVGDLTGVPLLKFAADTGARAVRTIAGDPSFARRERDPGGSVHDLVIVGGGVSGMSAALAARELSLHFVVIEASEPFSTIVNFPKAKPIFTYPTTMVPAGSLQLAAKVKEPLVEELKRQTTRAGIVPKPGRVERVHRKDGRLAVVLDGGETIFSHRVIIAIGRSGDFRRLGVPGEDLGKVANRLHDPNDFAGQDVLVVGGGDSALETAIALADAGGRVTLSHRGSELSRPKPELVEAAASRPALRLAPGTRVREIRAADAVLAQDGGPDVTLANDAVFTMIGREAPLDLLRRQDGLAAPCRADTIEALHAIIGRHDGRGIEAGGVDETKPKLAFGPAAAGAAKARREVALKLLFRKRPVVTEDAGAGAIDHQRTSARHVTRHARQRLGNGVSDHGIGPQLGRADRTGQGGDRRREPHTDHRFR